MKSPFLHAALAFSLLGLVVITFNQDASARDIVLPAGTLLQCTLNEPNLSTNTMDVGDPVLCHLRGITEFGQQAFPRGSYLVGHLDAAKDPGHFWGKGYLKLQFDRIGLPTGDLPLDAKVISTKGYKVDKQGKIDGKGHPRRDVVEWLLPPLWPWKFVMLPARGPRPKLKGETVLSMRLMDDVSIPQVAQTNGPGWHFFNRMSETWEDAKAAFARPQLTARPNSDGQVSYANYVTADNTAASLAAPGMPVFVLNSGTVLAVSAYGYQDSRISYTLVGGGTGVISTDEVDWSTTTRVNNKRGVHLTLHAGHPATGTPGM
jgi:hypothetical protein